jgi:hypothetical protein
MWCHFAGGRIRLKGSTIGSVFPEQIDSCSKDTSPIVVAVINGKVLRPLRKGCIHLVYMRPLSSFYYEGPCQRRLDLEGVLR